tara:strand:+ start:117 stop:449 length:333 start_codon:yes stop_codon:yes gene_type:complete
MSKFFESEIIRDELKEINQLQQDVYGSMLSFGDMDREDQIEHIEMLSILLDKQRVMYTRLSLTDDPDALKMKEQLEKSVELMGFPAGTDISVLFNGMTQTIDKLKKVVDY